VVSYHYGAANRQELGNLFRKSLVLMGIFGLIMATLSFTLASPFSHLFIKDNPHLYQMTLRGFRLYAFSFLISGFNLFASAFFTALNNGGVSALLSFSRTLVFQCVGILLLPYLWGMDGVWLATTAAELLSLSVTLFCFGKYRKRYGY
jgi:Na+-driven multidrug efflux pump